MKTTKHGLACQAQTENNQVSKKLADLIVADSTKTTLTYVSIQVCCHIRRTLNCLHCPSVLAQSPNQLTGCVQNVRLIPEGDPVPSPLTMRCSPDLRSAAVHA